MDVTPKVTNPSTPAAPAPNPRAGRPILRTASYHGGSFIQDHQQYRSPKPEPKLPPPSLASIDDLVGLSLASPPPFLARDDGAHAAASPSKIKESGIVHTLFNHASTSGMSGDGADIEGSGAVVATIFYKKNQPVHPPAAHPDVVAAASTSASPAASTTSLPPPPQPDAGAAPTTDLSQYPLEPPPPAPEPLDHLYGSHVSQICLTTFLQMIESLQTPYRRIQSSHRCLDNPSAPRIVEVTFAPGPNEEYLTLEEMRKHEAVWRFEKEWNVEVVMQRESVWRRYKRLAVFDMDSTLIQQEVIDEIARSVGVEKEVSEITSRAMNGELDFTASLKARVALLKGVPADVFEKIKPTITITPGAKELCRALKKLGFKMAVISGGFQPLAEWLAGELGLDWAFANHLEIDQATQTLTGTLSPDYEIISPLRKRALLLSLAEQHSIPLSQTMAVGDGANDLPMLHAAGLGVAWNAKAKVQMEAPVRLNGSTLEDLLALLGLGRADLEELAK